MKKKRRKGKLIVFLLILVGLGVGVPVYLKTRPAKLAQVTTAEVERRDITSVVSATGKIYPEVEVKISSEVAGEVVELPVKEGQEVTKGELLARVDAETYEAQVRQREAAINAARARSLQAEAQVMQAEIDLKRQEELFAKNILPKAEIENARTQVKIQKAMHEASRFEIKQQEMLLDESKERLSKTSIYAPMDGTITILNTELGERVVGTGQFEGTELMRVADMKNMEVRIQVNENDIVNVEVGDPVKVTLDAYPERELRGQVSEIANSAQTTGMGTQEEITNFEVRVKVLHLGLAVRPGMTATAEIQTETVEDVLSVPLQSVTVRERRVVDKALNGVGGAALPEGGAPANEEEDKEDGNELVRVVFVLAAGKAMMREVETGIADTQHMEIRAGVEEGEEVITGPYSAVSRDLEHGQSVEGTGGDDFSGFAED